MKRVLNHFAIRFLSLAIACSLGGCQSNETAETLGSGGPTNNAPTISGIPNSSALIDEQYSFTPSASDVDNDPLTFAVRGEPNWLTIDSANGAVAGTPTLADVGTYPGIAISVSDGSLSASLPQFTVTVMQNADGIVSLSWTAPTRNEDGSDLTNLAGFKIYYGTATGNYSNQIRIDNSTVSTFLVENLAPNTYYFAATSFNSSGVESNFSVEAVQSVN